MGDVRKLIEAVEAFAIGEEALQHMLDRRGLSGILEDIKDNDPEVWRDICEETGREAVAAILRAMEGRDG